MRSSAKMHSNPIATMAFVVLVAASIKGLQNIKCDDVLQGQNQRQQLQQSYGTNADLRSPGQYHQLFKRSLCNTFGGCGSKRSNLPTLTPMEMKRLVASSRGSMQGFEGSGDYNNAIHVPESASSSFHEPQNSASKSKALIAEALNDLYEHLQANKQFKQAPKLVLVLPTQQQQTYGEQDELLVD